MEKDEIIALLLIAMAIVLTIELAYILLRKKRRKEEAEMFRKSSDSAEPVADRAHNNIVTAESISATLAGQGVSTGEADEIIRQAKKEMAMKDYPSALERAEAAKLALLRAKRNHASKHGEIEAPHTDPERRPMNKSIYDSPKEPIREERSPDSLPANYVQAKFILSTTKDLLEKKNISSGEAYDFYSDAVSAFKREDYTKALSLAVKAEKRLDSGTLTLIGEEKPVASSAEVIEVLVCPGCDSEVSEEDAFCRECGQNLEAAQECPGCGNEFGPGDKFCRKCGRNLK